MSKDLIARALAYQLQEDRLGGLPPQFRKLLAVAAKNVGAHSRRLVGSVIVREHQGAMHEVVVAPDGYSWQGQSYSSLSAIALKITGTNWNGPRFFGVRDDVATSAVDEAHAPRFRGIRGRPGGGA